MCGIVGYVGKRSASDILINGLRRLEYRGYDSAGLALLVDGRLTVVKQTGKVASLEKRLCETVHIRPSVFLRAGAPAPTRQASFCPADLKTRPSYVFRAPPSTPGVRKSLPGLPRSLTRCPELDRSAFIRLRRIPHPPENAVHIRPSVFCPCWRTRAHTPSQSLPSRPENAAILCLSTPRVNAGRQKIPSGPAPLPYALPRT